MKKIAAKVFVFACYLIVVPVLAVFAIGMIVWENVDWICEFKEFMPFEYSVDLLKAMIEGVKEGHATNMERINALYDEV